MIADLYQSQRSPTGQSLRRQVLPEASSRRTRRSRRPASASRGKLLVFYQQDRAIQELERALATNPNLRPALALLASIHVGNGYYEKADGLLERALAVNPVRPRGAGRQGGATLDHGQARGVRRRSRRRCWRCNPTDGRFFVTISDLVGRAAAPLRRRGRARREGDRDRSERPPGLRDLRRGPDEPRAGPRRRASSSTIAVDKSKRYKDVKRDNWLEVLDVLDDFRTVDHRELRHPHASRPSSTSWSATSPTSWRSRGACSRRSTASRRRVRSSSTRSTAPTTSRCAASGSRACPRSASASAT